MNKTFVYVSYIKTTPELLWKALTSSEFTKQYWFGYTIESDWKVGSEVKLYNPEGKLAHQDKVLRAENPKVLSYTWTPVQEEFRGEASSKVTFEIEPDSEEVMKLTVTHADFPENSKVFPKIIIGWPAVLSSLKTLLESGKALSL